MSINTKLDEYKQQVADYFNSRTNYDRSNLANRRASKFIELLPLQKGPPCTEEPLFIGKL